MSIYTKLLEIQKKHLAFEKDSANPFFKSKYISLDSIVEKVTPPCDELGLVILHYSSEQRVITEIHDTESNTAVLSSFPLIESNDPQKIGSCVTYARRYNLAQLFNIITDRDDDGNEASKPEMGDEEFEKLKENKDMFKNGNEAVKMARSKYSVTPEMEKDIRGLFDVEDLVTPKF